jgi:hypothetical protein
VDIHHVPLRRPRQLGNATRSVHQQSEPAADGGIITWFSALTPPTTTIRLTSGLLEIDRDAVETNSMLGVSATQDVRFCYHSDDALNLEQCTQEFITPLRYFLTLATASKVPLPKVHVAGPKQDRYGKLVWPRQLELRRPGDHDASEEVDRWETLLPFDDDRVDIEQVLTRWFGVFSKYQNALDLLFAVTLGPQVYLETRFVLLAQAAEVYHRRAHRQERTCSRSAMVTRQAHVQQRALAGATSR